MEWPLAARSKVSEVGGRDVLADHTDLRRLNTSSEFSLTRMLAATRRLLMDTEGCFVAPRPRSTRCCGSDRQDVCSRPRLDRTNREFLRGSSLAANRDPHGFLDKGDVMIHRPYLVAWPMGSDRRTQRPSRAFDCEDRSKRT
jgi:hypothetical protein